MIANRTANARLSPPQPGTVHNDPAYGVVVTDARGRSLTVADMGAGRLDVWVSEAIRLDTATLRTFATQLLEFIDYVEAMRQRAG